MFKKIRKKNKKNTLVSQLKKLIKNSIIYNTQKINIKSKNISSHTLTHVLLIVPNCIYVVFLKKLGKKVKNFIL